MNNPYNPDLYYPPSFGRYFTEISAIPRGSGNEGAIAEYLCRFASERGFFCVKDAQNNVFIRRETQNPRLRLLLQGHTDMVCEKNGATKHDFEQEGLQLYTDGDILRASGTTLGGDDGAGVAMMLSLLEDAATADITLECLFTTEEETGMTGARAFDYSLVTADYCINLDCEGEGVAFVSCAGGMDTTLTFNCGKTPFHGKAMRISVVGLAGGHSGSDIDKNRASANRLMGIMLARLYEFAPFSLVSIDGGNKRNAIARECTAVIATEDEGKTKELLTYFARELSNALSDADKGFRLKITKHPAPDEIVTYKTTSAILSAFALAPDGVLNMSPNFPGLVESSISLGVVETKGDVVSLTWMSRSSVDFRFDELEMKFGRLAALTGANASHSGRYQGWQFKEGRLAPLFVETYHELFGGEPCTRAIHAGLECGIVVSGIKAARNASPIRGLPAEIDCISIGLDIADIHTPDEAMDLKSCERTYKVLVETIKKLG